MWRSKVNTVKMKLPPLKGVLSHISYWSCVAIFTVISTAIGIRFYFIEMKWTKVYRISSNSFRPWIVFILHKAKFKKEYYSRKYGIQNFYYIELTILRPCFRKWICNSYLSLTVIYYAWRAKSGYPTAFGQSTPKFDLSMIEQSSITTTTSTTSTMTTTSILDTTSTQTTTSTTTSVMSCKIFWFTLITYFKLPMKTWKNEHSPAQLKASKRHSHSKWALVGDTAMSQYRPTPNPVFHVCKRYKKIWACIFHGLTHTSKIQKTCIGLMNLLPTTEFSDPGKPPLSPTRSHLLWA